MRRSNTSLTLQSMASIRTPVTISALALKTGLSRRTSELIVERLIEDGWVEKLDLERSAGRGRPARVYRFEPRRWLTAGARIGAVRTEVIVCDLFGHVLTRAAAPSEDPYTPSTSLDQVQKLIAAAIEPLGPARDRVHAVGLALPGVIREGGTVGLLTGADRWTGVNAASGLSDRVDLPVFVGNDANLSALGERWLGAARGLDSFVWLVAGDRNGAGIVIGGKVHHGAGGAAGEIVHAEAFGLRQLSGHPAGLLTSPDPVLQGQASALLRRAWENDETAIEQVDEYLRPTAAVLSALIWTVAPPVVVFGGGMEAGGPELLDRLSARIESAGAPPTALRYGKLGSDAPLLGAIRHALDHADADIFGPSVF